MRRKQKNEKYLLPDIFLNRRQALRCIDHHRDQQNTIDLIDRIGPGGHYLNEDHTMRHFRKVWYPDLFDHTIYDDWQKQGAKRFENASGKKH